MWHSLAMVERGNHGLTPNREAPRVRPHTKRGPAGQAGLDCCPNG
jgi:hypothetical protein